MSAIRLAVTVVSAAMTMSRHPAVRAGIQAVASNPKAREAAANDEDIGRLVEAFFFPKRCLHI